ncbi:LPXTG cell wall anchor domain-containing protein, partial [Gemella sp.]
DKNPGKEVTVGDDGTATVTDPTTGISHTIPGTDLVNQDFEPVIPADKIPVKDPDNLTQEEQDKVKESVKKSNPGKKVTVDKTGKVTITDPNTNISHEIPREKLITLDPPVFELPEYTKPIGTSGVDENGNLLEPPIKHQTKLIITKWVDEKGNELKPADAKAPKVLGEDNEAFEAGEIEGYGFVRTETKGDVVTHIFRKVTATKPQPIPTLPEANENIKQTPTGKVEKSTKRLANTGESETNTGLAGLGLAVLGSLLTVAKRRREDEE